MSLRWLGCVTLAVWLCTTSPRRVQANDRTPNYQTTIQQAVSEFGLGNYAEARALFRKAHGISANARTWRGMGMAAFELKMYVEALRELSAALDNKERPVTAEQRVQLQSLVDQSRAFVGRYQLVLQPAAAHASVDGQDAVFEPGQVLLLGLGEHIVSAVAEGYQEARVPLHVDGGEDLVLRVELARSDTAEADALARSPMPAQPPSPTASASTTPAPPLPVRHESFPTAQAGSGLAVAGWITLGGAALLGGLSAASWLVGNNKFDQLQKECMASCSEARLAPLKQTDLLTNVFLATSLVAAGTAAVLLVLDAAGDKTSDKDASAAIGVSARGLTLHGSF